MPTDRNPPRQAAFCTVRTGRTVHKARAAHFVCDTSIGGGAGCVLRRLVWLWDDPSVHEPAVAPCMFILFFQVLHRTAAPAALACVSSDTEDGTAFFAYIPHMCGFSSEKGRESEERAVEWVM